MANSTLSRRPIKLTHSASPSTASSVEFTNLSSDYLFYEIILANVTPSADCSLYLRTSSNNGVSYDSGASDYVYGVYQWTTSGGLAFSTGAAQIALITTGGGTGSNEDICGTIWLMRPSDTEYCGLEWAIHGEDASSVIKGYVGGGERVTAADVDAIQILPSTGTITGEIRVYGHGE